MDKMEELEKLARAASPGPWERDAEDEHAVSDVADNMGTVASFCPNPADAAYIAAASPEVILRLVAIARAAEWQPIETAPRDGTRFLAVCSGPHIRLVRYDAPDDRLPIGDGRGDVWPDLPTHWMQLPKPPVTPEAKDPQ